MLDSAQTIISLVIVILTVIFVALGIQAFFVLRDIQKTVNKTNNILDGVNTGSNIIKVVSSAAALFLGGKKLKQEFKGIISDIKEDPVKEVLKVVNSEEVKQIVKKEVKEKPKKIVRRFFRRS